MMKEGNEAKGVQNRHDHHRLHTGRPLYLESAFRSYVEEERPFEGTRRSSSIGGSMVLDTDVDMTIPEGSCGALGFAPS